DHPICRRCGFDLTGRPPGSDRCSECGADLLRPHAVRAGHRQRRPYVLSAGVGSLLVGVLVTAWVIIQGGGWDIGPYKPLWLLRRELDAGPAAQLAAVREIVRRMNSGAIPRNQFLPIVDRA